MASTRSNRTLPLALAFVLLGAAACTDSPEPPGSSPAADSGVPATGFTLVAFDSCADVADRLREAAKKSVGPWGFTDGGGPVTFLGGEEAARADAGAATDQAAPGFSGTNVHEQGVDEPDLVKTDGRRIVTVGYDPDGTGGARLRVVDAATRRQTGLLELKGAPSAESLLLSGDRALVLASSWDPRGHPELFDGKRAIADSQVVSGGLDLRLIDLSGAPREIGRYRTDGALVDARQVGGTVRVVVRSGPRLAFPIDKSATTAPDETAATDANRRIVEESPDDVWLPRFEVTGPGGDTRKGTVECDRISRPATYSGTRMLTMLSFDLGATELGDGDGVSVAADAGTVYGTDRSVYLADDGSSWSWRSEAESQAIRTEIYKFDTSGTGAPRFVASGAVAGRLLNQYSLSEWEGHLRVATTTDNRDGAQSPPAGRESHSTVFVLGQQGDRLAELGKVGGLGKGERIFAVRFIGTQGYVVTFRQVDPLYTLDLSDPARPAVRGELKIPGYSAYLHPAGAGRLIGVGQDATEEGQATGAQVSLFDVADPAKPSRLAQHRLPGAWADAEHDAHAFLYWPATQQLVLPVYGNGDRGDAGARALVLRVGATGLTEAGAVTHPGGEPIRRSLVIGDTLWTVSARGLKANDLATLAERAWLPES